MDRVGKLKLCHTTTPPTQKLFIILEKNKEKVGIYTVNLPLVHQQIKIRDMNI
jgi:hypothetical protein